MTVKEYISGKFRKFGIQLSEADLLGMSLKANVDFGEEMSQDNITAVEVAMARFIPELLGCAASVSESGFSMSWDKQGIKDYYAMLCRQYGLKDELNGNKPQIRLL